LRKTDFIKIKNLKFKKLSEKIYKIVEKATIYNKKIKIKYY